MNGRNYVRSATGRNAHNSGRRLLISSVEMTPARSSKSSCRPVFIASQARMLILVFYVAVLPLFVDHFSHNS